MEQQNNSTDQMRDRLCAELRPTYVQKAGLLVKNIKLRSLLEHCLSVHASRADIFSRILLRLVQCISVICLVSALFTFLTFSFVLFPSVVR